MDKLEEKIGYRFRNRELLLTALTQTLIVSVKSAGSFSAIWTAILQTLWSLPVSALVYFPPARWIE